MSDRAQAVDAILDYLDEGRMVAIALEDHWLAATAQRDGAEGRQILIHDSWSGRSEWVDESVIRQDDGAWIGTYFPELNSTSDGSIWSLIGTGEGARSAARRDRSKTLSASTL